MSDDGVSLRSAAHPRPSWWRRLFWWILPRPPINPASLVQTMLEIPDPPEPQSLVDKLRAIGALQLGQPLPRWLYDEHNSWAAKLSQMLNDAADALESRRRRQESYKVMTAEEYAAMPIIGWHEVCRDIDGAGGVGIHYLSEL